MELSFSATGWVCNVAASLIGPVPLFSIELKVIAGLSRISTPWDFRGFRSPSKERPSLSASASGILPNDSV